MRLVINMTSYLVPFRSYRSLLFKFRHFAFLSHPLGQRMMFILGSLESACLEVCGSTRTRGYGSGTGRCLTGRVGYGYEVHGSGIPVSTGKERHFSRCSSYIECFFSSFLANVVVRPSVCRLSVCLSVVCNVRDPLLRGLNFRQCFYAI